MHPPSSPRRPCLLFAALALAGLAGCASTSAPVVYPSAKPQQADRAQADLASCRAAADAAVGINGHQGQAAATRAGQRGAGV